VDNGPGWVGVLLPDAEAVLALRPVHSDLYVGVAGPHPPGAAEALEVRAFVSFKGSVVEDPVTGSVNASLAQWLTETGRIRTPYTARQGTRLGRNGRVHISHDDAGTLWVGGATTTIVDGRVAF
jgi:PhzF family phenazine biosynthesis protein